MKIIIYRGTKEIGGTLIELKSESSRILIDAGYPLFLDSKPLDKDIFELSAENLLKLGVLPGIKGLYHWDIAGFDAVIISHAHLDHYGLLRFINPKIPVYLSKGTQKIIEISQIFKIVESYILNIANFQMYKPLQVGDFTIRPFLMDHSAFDAAAFEISAKGKTVIYTGDFRGHGRKAVCLDRFIEGAKKQADLLLTEGTMLGRKGETILTEQALEEEVVKTIEDFTGPILFQSSSQNIDRIVSFFKAAQKLKKTFVVDIYTANILNELRQLGNKLPYPSKEYPSVRVFYPFRLTQKIFNEIGEDYARRFAEFRISRKEISEKQNNIMMIVRPSLTRDLMHCKFQDGIFIYSMWEGYRDSDYQQRFESYLAEAGFKQYHIHTSGHASVSDVKKTIEGLEPKLIIPVHTMVPEEFSGLSERVSLLKDGEEFDVT